MGECINSYGDLLAFIIGVAVVGLVIYLGSKNDSNDIHRYFRDKLEDED